jgi:ABC-2 type transport system permease protein
MLLFGTAMITLGTLAGLSVRTPGAVAGIVFMTALPLTFLANAFVPSGSLPDGLRQIAEYNPISAIVAAVRTLLGNPIALADGAPWPLLHPVLAGFGWSLLVLAVTAPLCVARFRARTTD